MTTELLSKLVQKLNKSDAIPSGIDYITRLNIVDVRAINYKFYGNKHQEYGETFENTIVSILFEHAQVERPFWINIFKGAQYRTEDAQIVTASFSEHIDINDALCAENGAVYKGEGIEEGNNEVIDDIVFAFTCKFFDGDEVGLYHSGRPLIDESNHYLFDLAQSVYELRNITFNRSLSAVNPVPSHIKEAGERYFKAASGQLYYVSVVKDNRIEKIQLNLEEEEALDAYISLANEWYEYDGVFADIDEVQTFENNKGYTNINVALEAM